MTEAEKGNERRLYVQSISGLIPGQTYTIGGWFYTENLVGGNFWKKAYAGMKIEIASSTGSTAASKSLEMLPGTTLPYGEWTYGEVSIVCPEGVPGTASIHVRHDGIGTVYYDDLHVTGPTTVEKAEYIANKKAIYQEGFDRAIAFATKTENYTLNATLADGAVNFVKNNGYETASKYYNDTDAEFFEEDGDLNSGASNWNRSNYGRNQGSPAPEIVSRSNDMAHSGDYSMKIHIPQNFSAENNPYIMQTLTPTGDETFVAGAEYILSSWIKTTDVAYGSGVYYKIQVNYPGGNYTFSNQSVKVYDADEDWKELKYVITMPENITSVYIYIRLYGKGTFYCDDVSFGRSSNNDPLDFYTEHTFYYTDDDNLDATANIKTNLFDIENGSTVTFTVKDENGNAVATQTVNASASNSVTFPISTLANKQTAYTMNVEYKNSSGTVLSSASKRIYRYDRPTALNQDNNYVDPVTGEEMYPFFMYGATFDNHANLAAGGFTIIRTDMNIGKDDTIIAALDDAYSKGMKVLFALYGAPAGHPKQIERTRTLVSTYKDHPALAAWMLMDEPSLHVSEGAILTYDEMLYYLEEGYKAVREIDPVHPVYNIETVGACDDSYERTGQMCDIFAIDPYPGSLQASISGSLVSATQRARNAVYDERPVWVLGLAADWSGSYGNPIINSAMLRFQVYDALWAGAKGAGHYLSAPSDKNYIAENPDTYKTKNTEIYNETFIKANETGEIKELFEHFSLGKHTVFNEGMGNGYRYRTWYKDNGDMYMAVTSQIAKNDKNKDVMLDSLVTDIKLVSNDGTVSVDGFDATLVNGVSEELITSSDNTFAMTLTVGEASLYKITPAEDVDFEFSGTKTPSALGEEMIENGNCDNVVPTGLIPHRSQATGVEFTTDESFSGNGSVKVYQLTSGSSPNENAIAKFVDMPIEHSSQYILSFDTKVPYATAQEHSPYVQIYYNNENGTRVKTETINLYNGFINSDKWSSYKLTLTAPEDTSATKATIYFYFPKGSLGRNRTAYLDNISLRKVVAYNESQYLSNTSFELFITNASYTSANGTQPAGGWNTGGSQYADFYVPPISEVSPHSGNHSIGLAANGTILRQESVPLDYGKTYEISIWFNGKNLVDETTYPQIRLQTSGTVAYGQAGGHETKWFNFTDAYEKRNDGWIKLTAEYTVPEYQDGYDITKANLQFIMAGSSPDVIGYFDDASFRIKSDKPGYVLRNLETTVTETNVTVNYDVTNNLTESGGTVFYIFYDADGRFVKMEKETAAFDTLHVTRTFDIVDFTSMKVFVWDSLGGLIPYSNMIE